MEVNKSKEKKFDAVKMMRDIRKKINSETKDMSFDELRKYIDEKLSHKATLIGQK